MTIDWTQITLEPIESADSMKARLRDLLTREWLTPVDALQKAGCFSLSQRCGNFRSEGLRVLDKWVDLPSGKRVKAYHIEASA